MKDKLSYGTLIEKIEAYIHKFYLNEMLRGSIYLSGILALVYIVCFSYVYYMHPQTGTKTFLFYVFIALFFILLYFFILRHALALFKLGKHLSLEDAAGLIGQHFPEVKDKLINTLQLKQLLQPQHTEYAIIEAGINQKIAQLSPIPFKKAIKISNNKKYLKYVLWPVLLIITILFLAPRMIKEGTYSFLKYQTYIPPQAPYQIKIKQTLEVLQGDDLSIDLYLSGDEFPDVMYIEEGGQQYLLSKEALNHFKYNFKNVQQSKRFYIKGGGFQSAAYLLKVMPKSKILALNARLDFPAYLGKKGQYIENLSDLIIPEGTYIKWEVETKDAQLLEFTINSISKTLRIENNRAAWNSRLLQDAKYRLEPKNPGLKTGSNIEHQIRVIKDLAPEIQLQQQQDTQQQKVLYFNGKISDDYGFSYLQLRYTIKGQDKSSKSFIRPININKKSLVNDFFFFWDLSSLKLEPGDALSYYLEVADNDGVNGAKITRTSVQQVLTPSLEMQLALRDSLAQKLSLKIENTSRMASALQAESKHIAEQMLDKKTLSNSDRKQIESLLQKQKNLQQSVKALQDLSRLKNEENTDNKALNEASKEKENKLQALLDQMISPESQQLMEALQQLLAEQDKTQMQQGLSKMQSEQKNMKQELDRILELYKNLSFEQGLQAQISQLETLAQEQEKLSKPSSQKTHSPATEKKEQQALSQSLKDLAQNLKQLNDKNKALERPQSFELPEKELQDIKSAQEQAEKALQQNQKNQAQKSQQSAAQQMQQLAEKLKQGESMQQHINLQELRQLLQNLLKTSFEQEQLMTAAKQRSLSLEEQQLKQQFIKENVQNLSDSLYSLSKRVPEMEQMVQAEMTQLKTAVNEAIEAFGGKNSAKINMAQRKAMTTLNNMALFLEDVLRQIQKMQKNAKGGAGQQSESLQQLAQMQSELNKRMEQARAELQQQQNPSGTSAQPQWSKSFAEMARQQQRIREALKAFNRTEHKDNKAGAAKLDALNNEMKKTELDLLNKRITGATLERQKALSIKLLEADEALKAQEESAKREAQSSTQFPPQYKSLLESFKKQQQQTQSGLDKIPPGLNYYYKNKVKSYIKSLNLPLQNSTNGKD